MFSKTDQVLFLASWSWFAAAVAVVVAPAGIAMPVEFVLEVFEDWQCLQLNTGEEGKPQDKCIEF